MQERSNEKKKYDREIVLLGHYFEIDWSRIEESFTENSVLKRWKDRSWILQSIRR